MDSRTAPQTIEGLFVVHMADRRLALTDESISFRPRRSIMSFDQLRVSVVRTHTALCALDAVEGYPVYPSTESRRPPTRRPKVPH